MCSPGGCFLRRCIIPRPLYQPWFAICFLDLIGLLLLAERALFGPKENSTPDPRLSIVLRSHGDGAEKCPILSSGGHLAAVTRGIRVLDTSQRDRGHEFDFEILVDEAEKQSKTRAHSWRVADGCWADLSLQESQ